MKRLLVLSSLWLFACSTGQHASGPSTRPAGETTGNAPPADTNTLSSEDDPGRSSVEGPQNASSYRIGTDQNIVPCELPAPKNMPRGAVVTLAEAERYCDVTAVPVTVLRPSPSGSHPDPGNTALMTGTGRFVTRTASSVTVWDRNGSVEHTFGRRGEAPGEFASGGALKIFLGARDSLYVLDDSGRWSVFEPQNFEFRRTFNHPAALFTAYAIEVTGDGILITGDFSGRGTGAPFHLIDLEGSLIRSFGPEQPRRASSPEIMYQLSAYDGKNGFWVVPRNGTPTGMTLEYWTTEGERLVTLRREVPWLPSSGYPQVDDPTEPALPEYDHIYVDSRGLIWVGVIVRDPRWRPVTGPEKRDVASELWDVRVEVIDPRSATVIASFIHDGPSEEVPPMARLFPNSSRSYRPSPDEMQRGSVEIFDIHLTRP
jgi:hypothetical protein